MEAALSKVGSRDSLRKEKLKRYLLSWNRSQGQGIMIRKRTTWNQSHNSPFFRRLTIWEIRIRGEELIQSPRRRVKLECMRTSRHWQITRERWKIKKHLLLGQQPMKSNKTSMLEVSLGTRVRNLDSCKNRQMNWDLANTIY